MVVKRKSIAKNAHKKGTTVAGKGTNPVVRKAMLRTMPIRRPPKRQNLIQRQSFNILLLYS